MTCTVKLSPTVQVVKFQGVACRVWEGTSESGATIVAFIPRISLAEDAPASEHAEWDRVLLAAPKPQPRHVFPDELF